MKRFLLLILGLVMFSNMQAQLKTVTPGNSISVDEHEIVPPASKLNTSFQNRESGTFIQKKIDFVVNLENGLSVEMRSKERQLPILIKGESLNCL